MFHLSNVRKCLITLLYLIFSQHTCIHKALASCENMKESGKIRSILKVWSTREELTVSAKMACLVLQNRFTFLTEFH